MQCLYPCLLLPWAKEKYLYCKKKKKKKFKILKCVEVLQTYITLVKLNKSNIAQLKMSLMSMKCFFNPAMIHKSSRLRIPSHSEVQAELAKRCGFTSLTKDLMKVSASCRCFSVGGRVCRGGVSFDRALVSHFPVLVSRRPHYENEWGGLED